MGKRVLLVDDNRLILTLYKEALRLKGHELRAFSDPHEALAHLGADERFDLILVDCRMPQMTGRDFLRRLRAKRPALALIPTVGLSNLSHESPLASEMRQEVTEFIEKPQDIEGLLGIVDKFSRH